MIGRESDAARVLRALERSNVCAIVGPGGVGKSTLAGELAAPLRERAELVDVRSVDHPEVVLARIAEAIDADHVVHTRIDDIEQLCFMLAARLSAADVDMLVVDDVDRHSDAIFDLLATVGQRTPAVSIVITSRNHPARSSVQTVRLAPLGIGEDGGLVESTGITLFRQAFTQAGGDPEVLDSEMDVIHQLVAATGGLPLAIIVMAARAAMIGAQNALEDVDQSSPVGVGATHGDPVAAVLARSLQNLDATSLDVFEAIGTFRGNASIDHVASVCAGERMSVTSAIDRLARRSLVAVESGRITMLPPIRRLALSHAEHRGRLGWLEQRRTAWALEMCTTGPTLSTSQVGAIEDDLVSAVFAALRDERVDVAVAIAKVVEDAFRADLRHGRRLEVLEPVMDACRQAAGARVSGDRLIDLTIEMMRLTAIARADASGWAAASPLLAEAAALLPRSGDPTRHAARINALRATLWFESGDLESARRDSNAAIESGRAAGDALGMYRSMKLLADVELDSGHIEEALRLAHDVVRSAPPELRWLGSYALSTVAMCELERGATAIVLAAAQRLGDEATENGDMDLIAEADWLRAMADPHDIPPASHDLAGDRAGNSIIHIQADIARAIRRLAGGDARAAITLAADCELRAGVLPMRALALDAQLLVGDAAIELGEFAEARRAYAQALNDSFTHGYRLRVPDALDGLAVLALSGNDIDTHNACRRAASTIRSDLGVVGRPRPWSAEPMVPPGRPPASWIVAGTLTQTGLQGAMGSARGENQPPRTASLALSPAERLVADLVADGHTNREIGDRLFVSRRTVETHISHAFQKLNVTSRTQLAGVVLNERTFRNTS